MSPSRRPQPAVLKYYLFQVADSVGFIWPIFTLFLLWNDLTYTQIGTLSAISALLVVAFEVPTGYLADRIGRRNTLAIGMAAMSVSLAGFVLASTFPEFVALYVVWALAMSLHHGTADAWLYGMLEERTDAESFTRIRGRGGAVYQVASAVTMIGGGFLYVLHPSTLRIIWCFYLGHPTFDLVETLGSHRRSFEGTIECRPVPFCNMFHFLSR